MSDEQTWEALRRAFITDPTKPTLANFCGTQNLSLSTVKKRSAAEKWVEARNQYWNQVELKAGEKLVDLQATVVARDTAQKLTEIRRMKDVALASAVGTEENPVAYEKPHEAVAAYERLEKLERLILGESTEIIKVDDARQMVQVVIQVIREEVRDSDTANRIAARLANLGTAEPGGPDARANATA